MSSLFLSPGLRDWPALFLRILLLCLPARLTVEQVAILLHTTCEGIYALTSGRLLKPLGSPPRNGTKYYSRDYILELMSNQAWLTKMSDALVLFKREKNRKAKMKKAAKMKKDANARRKAQQ